MKNKQHVLGVDVGGTNIKIGLISGQGRVVARSALNTKAFGSDKVLLIEGLCEGIRALVRHQMGTFKDIKGLGIGLPGLIDPLNGRVIFLPNVPGWRNVPLQSLLKKKLRLPVFLENDVNLIALGEWKFGAGQGCQDMICLTLGTGVGAGLVLNGQLYRGAGFCAGELGHVPLNEKGRPCPCGGWGCFERYVGNAQLLKDIRRIYHDRSKLIQDLYPLALRGEKRALRFWAETGTRIGNGLVGTVNLLNPRRVVIGGGVANNYRFFAPNLKATLKERAMQVQGQMAKVVKAKLGDDAGLVGASVLVNQELNRKR